MKKFRKKILTKIADMALKAAVVSADKASYAGIYQPKMPEVLNFGEKSVMERQQPV